MAAKRKGRGASKPAKRSAGRANAAPAVTDEEYALIRQRLARRRYSDGCPNCVPLEPGAGQGPIGMWFLCAACMDGWAAEHGLSVDAPAPKRGPWAIRRAVAEYIGFQRGIPGHARLHHVRQALAVIEYLARAAKLATEAQASGGESLFHTQLIQRMHDHLFGTTMRRCQFVWLLDDAETLMHVEGQPDDAVQRVCSVAKRIDPAFSELLPGRVRAELERLRPDAPKVGRNAVTTVAAAARLSVEAKAFGDGGDESTRETSDVRTAKRAFELALKHHHAA